ncbi:protein YgfX [Pseudomonas sp. zfem004]|uniref:protein YgfX n=1 Tax=unclassified Pseudomonas TaxID=196821 RepID=UPI00129BEFE9|nr:MULTISPECIES: protein YgfX [unclassified Pseudomonas]MDU9405579.1 protein YgfX [Pseudomonas sp. zfem004]
MSSPSDRFECRWQGSRLLLTAYLASQALAIISLAVIALPLWLRGLLFFACLAHACWAIPRRILLTHPDAITGLRRDSRGWRLYSRARGWQAVRLCRDSIALPGLVVLRFVRKGRWLGESQCIVRDALAPEAHRRLRVRLKFSRRRWAAAG